MSNERDWPFEKIPDKGLRPWFLSADGYLFALFTEVDEARRAKQSLLEQGVPDEDARLYASAEILGIESHRTEEGSNLARAVAAFYGGRWGQETLPRYGTGRRGSALAVFSHRGGGQPTGAAPRRF